MSLLLALQSAIFYYMACTPCNEAMSRFNSKREAKKEREKKMRIQMEQPGLYVHPLPFDTNPYWREEIDSGPRRPKKSGFKNTSQRALNGASTGRNSTSATLANTNTNTSSNFDHSISLTSPTASPVDSPTPPVAGRIGSRDRYQREDEELWGHDLSRMGHRLVDNIVRAGNSAGRIIKGELGMEKQVTEEDRANFYLAPRNPPVNDFHPPIVGSTPVHKNALQWMLQPPPPAKLMEGKVPVSRVQSVGSMASRAGQSRRTSRASRASRIHRINRTRRDEHVDDSADEWLQAHDDLSESELIEVLIGTRTRRTTMSSRGRSLSIESDLYFESDTELVWVARHGRAASGMWGSDTRYEISGRHPSHSPTKGSSPRRAQRPRLGTIKTSQGNAVEESKTTIQDDESDTPTPRPSSPTPRNPFSPSTTTKGSLDLSTFHIENANTPTRAKS